MTISETLFKSWAKEQGFIVIRFADTKDTGELTEAQPSDFLLVRDDEISFAEVKETKKTTFAFSAVRPSQWAYADLVTKKKQKYTFYILSLSDNVWYHVPASVLLTAKREGRKSIKFEELKEYEVSR